MPACAERVHVVKKFDEVSRMDHTAVRTEITGSVTDHTASQKDTWKFLRAYTYPWISFRILKEDVVARFELFDEIIFQKKTMTIPTVWTGIEVHLLLLQMAV